MNDWIRTILEHPWGRAFLWVASALLLFLVLYTVRHFSLRENDRLNAHLPGQTFARLARRTNRIFLLFFAFWATSSLGEPNDAISSRLHKAMIIILGFQLILWAGVWVSVAVDRLLLPKISSGSQMATARMSRFALNLVVMVGIVVFTLDNLGINVTTLVAGLGIGGVAVALAVQNILGDLFSSLTIILDKPFQVGDFIAVGNEHLGSVEAVGLKTTRVRSLSGEQLIFSNSDLLQSRVRNYRRMERRRVVFGFAVAFGTPRATVEKVPGWVREFVQAQSKATFDRCHFKGFGASSLDFECVYWVESPDYNVYMDVQQAICLNLLERFQRDKVDFALPMQVNVVKGSNSPFVAPPETSPA